MSSTVPVMPAKGERYEGALTSDLRVLQGWEWPYVAIRGTEDGPRATIIAGIHGCEYVSIRAAVRLARELDSSEVRGQILIVPIVNLPSFWERTAFVNPIDGKNPNRLFPGSQTGTFTEAMDSFIFTSCILPSDSFIDLHGGDMVEELIPYTIYAADASTDVVARSRAMVEAFGLPRAKAQRQEPGERSGLTYAAAAREGIPGLIAEAGCLGQLTPADVDLLVAGTFRALQAAGNLPGEPTAPGPVHIITRSDRYYANADGFWIADVRAGDEVRAGQRLGRVFSLLGELVDTIESSGEGTVMLRTTSAAVKQGGLLINVSA